MRYTIVGVDRAGNSSDIASTDSPRTALEVMSLIKTKRGPRMAKGTAWVRDDESGESVAGQLEELNW
jgi:hypothetical protein